MIEILTFRLREDADVVAFLEIDGWVQTGVAYRCAGLLRRTIARNGDRWLVLQSWATPEACKAGRSAFESSAVGQRFLEFVDDSSVSVERFGDVA